MTADQSAAEESIRALARDLVEEMAAGRAVELSNRMAARDVPLSEDDDDDELGLAFFQVKTFQRQERTKSGQLITEQVRAHGAQREGLGGGLEHPGGFGGGEAHYVAGAPGHEVRGNISQAKWDANKWKKRTDTAQKTFEAVRDTRQHMQQVQVGSGVQHHLATAQRHLQTAVSTESAEDGKFGEHLSNAHEALAEAHRGITAVSLPEARNAKDRKDMQGVLDRIKGHMQDVDKQAGDVHGAGTKAVAAAAPSFDAKRAKGLDKLSASISSTLDATQGRNGHKNGEQVSEAQQLWNQHGRDSAQALGRAAQQLAFAQGGEHAALPEAYHQLAEAHRGGVEEILSRAQTPEVNAEVRKHLDLIQGHMEALDKIAGTKPDMTRKIVGTSAQHSERAAKVRDDARAAVLDAAEKGNARGVQAAARQHQGLVDPDIEKAAAERAGQVSSDKDAQQLESEFGLKVGDQVTTPEYAGVGPGTITRGSVNNVTITWPGGETSDEYPGDVKAVQPEYPRGASAVYPQVGTHARAVMPGGTFSGAENMGRISPVQQAAVVAQHPAEAELAQARQQMAKFAQREAQRRTSDLSGHIAEMKAAEARYRGIAAEGQYAPLSDEEFAAHKDFVSSQVEAALRAGLATDQQHSLDGKGQVWTPERATLHSEIVKDYMDRQVDVPSERQALFMGGLPGAGKSSTLRSHPNIDLGNYAVLNPDDFKEELMKRGMVPEAPGLSPMESAALVHEESAYLTDLVAHELERRGKNVAWDVTMKNHDITAARIKLLKGKNYRVHSVFVDVPVEKSASRVENRYRKGLEKYRKGDNPLGGRFIPRSVILAGEDTPGVSRAKVTFDRLKPEFASWELHDGSDGQSKLVAKSEPVSSAIPSVEALRKLGNGSTEESAQQAESGKTAEETAGLTQTNPDGTIKSEESESR